MGNRSLKKKCYFDLFKPRLRDLVGNFPVPLTDDVICAPWYDATVTTLLSGMKGWIGGCMLLRDNVFILFIYFFICLNLFNHTHKKPVFINKYYNYPDAIFLFFQICLWFNIVGTCISDFLSITSKFVTIFLTNTTFFVF